MDVFEYSLEQNLLTLQGELTTGAYRHGGYVRFVVSDNKRREIAVAGIRDRVVHRLLYGYLVGIYDSRFIPDVWSCRKGKGLVGAIERTQTLLRHHRKDFIWRSDVRKFFDTVDHEILKGVLMAGLSDPVAQRILWEVTGSYALGGMKGEFWAARKRGIPIGNLTSQVFSNIYLNEFDQYVRNRLGPQAYLRYGDDFFMIAETEEKVRAMKSDAEDFLSNRLRLSLHPKNGIIIPVKRGLKFLGVEIFPTGRRLKKRNWRRVLERSGMKNISSYAGLVRQHSKKNRVKEFQWTLLGKMGNDV